MKFQKVQPGEWVKPVMKGYLMKCCDCGLVHKLDFKVLKHARGHKVLFRAFRVESKKKKKAE